MKNIFRVMAGTVLFLGFLFTTYNSAEATTTYSPVGCTAITAYSPITGQKCIGSVLGDSSVDTSTIDTTPRIMYWYGKVNQHVDSNGIWQSDPDGTSGANLDKLTYCKKWYPNTTSVSSYKSETIDTWRRAMGYEQSGYTNTVVSDKCEQGIIITNPYITLLYPKSGDTFTSGQNINVTWSTNASPSTYVYVSVLDNFSNLIREIRTPNDGQEKIKIPLGTSAGQYKIYYQIVYGPNASGYHMTDFVNINIVSPIIINTGDTTPRIAYWWGKVNQHVDDHGNWLTDPDGVSGADLDKLKYCKKWYPNTTSIRDYKKETITGWRERGNVGGPYTLEVITIECVSATVSNASVKVLSPNGGEVFTVIPDPTGLNNWMTYKLSITSGKTGTLYKSIVQYPNINNLGVTLDFGSSNYTSPNGVIDSGGRFGDFMYPNGQYYVMAEWKSNDGTENIVDFSDKSFLINKPNGFPVICNRLASPSITVLSPNGGEVYNTGGKMIIKWKPCNIPKGSLARILLSRNLPNNHQETTVVLESTSGYDINTGYYVWQIPSTITPANNYFMTLVCGNSDTTSNCTYNGSAITDDSDNLFTINGSTTGECNNGGYIQTMNTNPRLKNWGVINPNQIPARIWIGDVTVKACDNLSLSSSEITVQADSGVGAFSSFEAFDGVNMVGSGPVFQSPGQLSWVTIMYNSSYPLTLNQSKTLTYWGYLNPLSNGRGSLSIIPKMTPPSSGTISPGDNPYTTADASFTLVNGLGGKINFSNLSSKILKIGSRGDTVKAIQELLNVKADGIYGRGTANRVKAWQLSNALKPDGIFGPASWAKINPSN